MSAMLRASLETYPGALAAGVGTALFMLFIGLGITVFRKKNRIGMEYASRLPLDQEGS